MIIKNNVMNTISTPFNSMLNSLRNIYGYPEFCDFINKRLNSNEDWRAEVKALFEINKNIHPLVRICSQSKSEPEGVFKIKDKEGIIEVAVVRYSFDNNFEKNKTINIIKNYLKPLTKKLVDKYQDYAIIFCLLSLANKPTEDELKKIKLDLTDFFSKNDDNLLNISEWVWLGVFPKNNFPSKTMLNPEIILSFEKSGTIVIAHNVNLNKKIINLIKSKRKQHKDKYDTFIKIYYFYINCPIPRLREIEDDLIQKELFDDEVLVINATSIINSILTENKKIFGAQKCLFDFSNSYYKNKS